MSGQLSTAAYNVAPRKPAHAPLTDESPFPFGKRYKGVRMDKVPAWYLDLAVDWQVTKAWYPEVIEYVERNRAAIDAELKEQGEHEQHLQDRRVEG